MASDRYKWVINSRGDGPGWYVVLWFDSHSEAMQNDVRKWTGSEWEGEALPVLMCIGPFDTRDDAEWWLSGHG